MRIFLTGSTGFIGSALVPELIQAGHQVIGLTRSETGAASLKAAGAQPHSGDLEDLDSLRTGAAQSDAVIHTAFNHDFSKFAENCAMDKRSIETLGTALQGSKRPLIVTSGLALLAQGRAATEDDAPVPPSDAFPRSSETTGLSFLDRGVKVSVMRLPQVHDTVKQGLVTYAIALARQKGVSAYLGQGLNRWSAAHVSDVARLYRLAVEKGEAGARYHAVAEEGISMRDIAEAIGSGLKIPVVSLASEEAPAHFGWLARFASLDLPATGTKTQQELGWHPTGPTLLTDLANMDYAA
ncbi:MAG TPA: SDR family oxidoreductase [Terracidiphilus sp.]|jgi:nucleoside-diphosphate-sugar epimerase|nr:SDR family oxidoreductase [Terracidiphilus sp.]